MKNLNKLTYVQATKDDLPLLVNFLADDILGAKREDNTMPLNQAYLDAYEAIDSDPNNELVVAKLDGEIVGTLQLTFIPYLTYTGSWRCLIEGVRVNKNYRGHGYGTALLQYAIERAKQRNCSLVQLTSNKQRDKALSFYKKFGFTDSHIGFKLQI